jgi:hypothetical protein
MRRTTTLFALTSAVVLSLAAGSARAQPYPTSPVWDSRGWVLLGETTVNGHGQLDRDSIRVAEIPGRFTKMTLVVENGEFEMMQFGIKFIDGSVYAPQVQHFFREGQRTRLIDLPRGEHMKVINFAYRNLSQVGHAHIQIWGWKEGTVIQPVPVPAPVVWDNRGWTLLGEREVNGHGQLDRDRIEVGGKWSGRFSKVTLVVMDGDLEMVDFEIKFGPGPGWHPGVSHFFREGQRTRVIDFPTNRYGDEARSIRTVEFAYRNLSYGRHARVQVWAWRADAPPVVVNPPPPVWDNRGWVLLGETTVHGRGREDRERINVGSDAGKYSQLTLVVTDADVELDDMIVHFRPGPWRPGVTHFFREGQRTRVIQFPPAPSGNPDRTIVFIDFLYRNLPGGGHAHVQVWAR